MFTFRKLLKFFLILLVNVLVVLFFCEFIIYYVVIYQCNYQNIRSENPESGLKAVILADTHMLGPFRGHPFDKLRREWQMKRSFQTAMQIFHPDVVFILGDVFDEGNWVDDSGFEEYVERFHTLFYTPSNTRMYPILGNHDVNFHYAMHPQLVKRFHTAFNMSGVSLIRERKEIDGNEFFINFVTVNSMAMEGDDCHLCFQAQSSLKSINSQLKKLKKENSYSAPFVLQHFPTYRDSDENCIEKNSKNNAKYREKWEALSKDASATIARLIEPRGYFSGHTHHYCKYIHKHKEDIPEFTVASFNWRNIDNPSFLLAIFTPDDFTISKCDMPKESTVYLCYAIGLFLSLILATMGSRRVSIKSKDM